MKANNEFYGRRRDEVNADEIREYINQKYFLPAREKGEQEVEVMAGNIRNFDQAGVCQVMRGDKIQRRYNVEIVGMRDGKGRVDSEARPGVYFSVTYRLLSETARLQRRTHPTNSTFGSDRPARIRELIRSVGTLCEDGIISAESRELIFDILNEELA